MISPASSNSRPLSCREVQRLMQRFLDGELPDSQVDLVAAHLEDCERCGIEAETYRRIKAALRRLRTDVDPAPLERLRAYIRGLTRPPEDD